MYGSLGDDSLKTNGYQGALPRGTNVHNPALLYGSAARLDAKAMRIRAMGVFSTKCAVTSCYCYAFSRSCRHVASRHHRQSHSSLRETDQGGEGWLERLASMDLDASDARCCARSRSSAIQTVSKWWPSTICLMLPPMRIS